MGWEPTYGDFPICVDSQMPSARSILYAACFLIYTGNVRMVRILGCVRGELCCMLTGKLVRGLGRICAL